MTNKQMIEKLGYYETVECDPCDGVTFYKNQKGISLDVCETNGYMFHCSGVMLSCVTTGFYADLGVALVSLSEVLHDEADRLKRRRDFVVKNANEAHVAYNHMIGR